MAVHVDVMFAEIPALASFPSSTERMKLIPRDRRVAEAEAGNHADFSQALGAAVTESWPPTFFPPFRGAETLSWRNYYLVSALPGEALGLAGFSGFALWPARRAIFFGAGLVPEFQGRRLGEELASAAAKWASSQAEIDWIISDIPADLEPGVKALTRAGFSKESDAPEPGFARFVRFVGVRAETETLVGTR